MCSPKLGFFHLDSMAIGENHTNRHLLGVASLAIYFKDVFKCHTGAEMTGP